MYFQYDTNGAPLGFIWNGTQYLYMTNQMGDVISITDNLGNELVQYEYDEWGAIGSITTMNNTSTENALANANPLRYRGCYYDNETGYYYLHSRYYDPSICRFINADVPEISQMSKDIPVGTNLFAYCSNDPVNNRDLDGHIAANVIGAIICGVLGAVGGYFFTRWLADRLNLTGWKRKVFIAGLTALIIASAAAIGYFVGPYVARAWASISTRLVGLLKGSFKSIGKISAHDFGHINTSKHLWKWVLGNQVNKNNITTLIYRGIRSGRWYIQNNGSVKILWTYKNEIIVITGKVVNKIFRIGNAWVWNGRDKL